MLNRIVGTIVLAAALAVPLTSAPAEARPICTNGVCNIPVCEGTAPYRSECIPPLPPKPHKKRLHHR